MANDVTTNRWWDGKALLGGETKARALVNVCKAISSNPVVVRDRQTDLRMARLYENDASISSLYQFGGATTSVRQPDDGYGAQPWNELRSCAEAAAAQVAGKKPRTKFITTGGDFKEREKADLLTSFTDAIRAETGLSEIAQDAFVDAEVFKYGCVQCFADRDRVAYQRVLAGEILVDPSEGQFGQPRSIHRQRPGDKDLVIAQFVDGNDQLTKTEKVKLENQIHKAPSIEGSRGSAASRMVWVYEGWHLPTHAEADDGRHVLAVNGVDMELVDEPHKRQRFPLLFFRWSKALTGFGGRSLAEIASYTQLEIRRLLEKIARGERLICVPHIGLKRGSKIVKNVNNDIGSYIEYTDTPPGFIVPGAFSPEVYAQLMRHCEKVWELAGVSKTFGTGQKPAGVISGPGQRETQDIASARFTLVQQRWDQFNVDLDRAGIDCAVDIYGEKKSYEVSANDTKLLRKIDWNQIKLDENQYVMLPYPTSLLPTTPGAKVETAKDMMASGLWDRTEAKLALGDLDIKGATDLDLGPRRDLERMLDGMLRDAKYEPPEPWMDVDLARALTQKYLGMGRADKAPPKNLDLLHRFLDDLSEMTTPPPAPAAPVGPADPALIQAQTALAGARASAIGPSQPVMPVGG